MSPRPLSRDEIIKRATELVKPIRHSRFLPDEKPIDAIRAQFREEVWWVLNTIERAEAGRQVNRHGSTKLKDVLPQFLRALRRVERLAKEQPAEMFENWEDPGHKFSSRERFLEHLGLTRQRAETYKAPRGPRSGMKKRHAAASALSILQEYCVSADAKKDGIFCRLTALLAGEPGANLQRYCKERLQRAERVVK